MAEQNKKEPTIMEKVQEGLTAEKYIDSLETIRIAIKNHFRQENQSEQVFREILKEKIRRVKK